MATDTPAPYLLLPCPVCSGTGREGVRRCTRCNGKGIYAWLNGRIIFWGQEIGWSKILERKIERMVRLSITAFLVFFGAIGIILVLLEALRSLSGGVISWESLFTRNAALTVFAVSMVADLYAYYRIDREATAQRSVLRRGFELERTAEDATALFAEASSLDARHLIDVSVAYDRQATDALQRAWMFSQRIRQGQAATIHLFGILLSYPDVQIILSRLGVNPDTLSEKIARAIERHGSTSDAPGAFTQELHTVLLDAYQEAFMSRLDKVGVGQLLVAVASQEGAPKEILYDLEIESQQVRNVVEWINIHRLRIHRVRRWQSRAVHKPKGAVNRAYTSLATPMLDRFSHDLTHLARSGALPVSIGRDSETEEVFRIIESGKGNPLLVGAPGVGKQSVVENIAAMMASEEVPEVLQDKRLVSLSLASFVGSFGRQGELEGRLVQLMNEIVRAGNIVLVIDNLQNMVGVSTEGAQNLDMADIFTQLLERRICVAIATTTPHDYQRYIETSGSLMRVFQRIEIDEPDENNTIQILESKVGAVEYKNNVLFSYKALEQIVRLTGRYIHDRFQPEKSITILEEVAVFVKKKKGHNAVVTADDVAEVISSRTRVPVTRVTQKESEKLLNLEQRIHERIVGQHEAVMAVSTALRRARAELRDIKRPIVNLLFLGPTGVGKTELAKAVSEIYFGSENAMIRLDMSEYQDPSSINRLIGAPPGYRGDAEGGYLTNAIRTNPFSLLLLDELEKAHPDILNIFLQVMDDGRLTDTSGRTIDFTNAIIIATSNAGSVHIQQGIRQGRTIEQIKSVLMEQELNQYFRPEFLNRFDGVIVFRPLTFEEIVQIVGLLLKQVAKRLEPKGITLRASPEAMEELAKVGFDPVFGARPLRRAIQDRVDNALANFMLQGKIGRRDVAVLQPGGQIRVERAQEL